MQRSELETQKPETVNQEPETVVQETVAPETADTQVEQVTEEPKPETQPGEIVVTEADVESMIAALKTKTQEAETVRQIGETAIDIDVPTTMSELVRIRDNNRLTYTENLARFRNAAGQLAIIKPKWAAKPEDENLKAGATELQAALVKYLERMRRYLKRYMVCRDDINTIRAKEKAAEEAKKAQAEQESLAPQEEPSVTVVENETQEAMEASFGGTSFTKE
jgi:hypothetical protein